MMPEGSVLAIHAPIIQPNFKVYSNLKEITNICLYLIVINIQVTPFNNTDCNLDGYIQKITDLKALKLIELLKISSDDINQIERLTRDQARCSLWFDKSNNRFTVSLCNKIKNGKSEKGLKTLAYNIVFQKDKNIKNNIVRKRMNHGKFYEPIAISNYEKYLLSENHVVTIEPCGLVIDKINFILGATPDRKVQVDGLFGIIEVKCSEEYKNIDPKDIL
nr:uncharacterized protein LOC124818853 [Hydra vulgaris]